MMTATNPKTHRFADAPDRKWRSPLLSALRFVGAALFALQAPGQTTTGPQQLAFAGLRSVANQGQFNAIKTDASGNLFLLLDQKDGVRILKTDPTATTLLAQAHLGAAGDSGLSLALDPAGDVYVAGTTTSTVLAGTSGAAFPTRADASTNSFVAKYDNSLNTLFVTFAGSGHLSATSVAATADAVFLTGNLFAATLPVTPAALQPTPASGSSQHGFVERFSADGSTLIYATYLTGAGGDTAPAAIAADAADNAYIAGSTSASGFPTQAALVPVIQAPTGGASASSGFLTKLTPAGDALVFSTFIPGAGVTSLALDAAANNLLLSGSIALGAFPAANAQAPLVALAYQVLVRMPLDGSGVLSSTVVAPGPQSFVTPAAGGTAWVDGALSATLLPVAALADTGGSFAAHVGAAGTIDQTARFGGLASTNQANASAPVMLTSVATDLSGQPFVAGVFTPAASSTLLGTQRYDLTLANASTAVLPSAVTDAALPPGSCSGSLCAGSAGYLAKLTTGNAVPALVFSVGASPDVLLRNLGSAQAAGVQVSATGFTVATSCGATLAAGGECAVALSGAGPGTLTVQATNATSETLSLPAVTTAPTPIVFSPRELDFGVQTTTSAPVLRTVTVTNLSSQTQSFTSQIEALNTTKGVAPPFTEASSDCATGMLAITKVLAAGSTCHITLALALGSTTADGPLVNLWKIAVSGAHDVLLTGYANAAALSVSASQVDFGTQYTGGLRSARFLYLSNNSDGAIAHATVSVSAPFTATDRCPATLAAHTVCQIQFAYESPTSPSVDSVTLALDQGLSVVVTGQTLPPPVTAVGTTNTSLTVSPSGVTFANAVPVTSQSSGTQTVSLANTGSAAFPLTLTLTGDFTDATNCTGVLAAHQTCSVVLTFSPTEPGTRTGVLTVNTSSGANPVYVSLTGTATAILTDSNGSTLQANPTVVFGGLYVGQPATQWFKVTQPFQSLTAAATGAFGVVLVEDIGFGHGSPTPAAFQATATGSCTNCYLGVQFQPTATGAQSATLSLTSSTFNNAYVLTLTGSGLPTTGLLVSPAAHDFGMVAVNSTSAPMLFSVTNLLATNAAVTIGQATVAGDFVLSPAATGGPGCAGTLAAAATRFVEVVFAPTATDARSGTLSFPAPSGSVTATLTGSGIADPGISLMPSALTFQPVPGPTATQQTVTVGNTGTANVQVGSITSTSAAFGVTSACATLAPTATCVVTVTCTAGTAQGSGSLQIPVTAGQTVTTYTVPLTGAFTSTTAGLQILQAQTDFGPTPVDTAGPTRTFTINNLTAQQQTLTMTLPRQFALTTPNPCPTLAADASCTFNVTSLPLTTSNTTGTIYAQALAADGVTRTSGLGYLQSYGSSAGGSSLRITGNFSPGTGFFDFGQVASGQTYTQTLRLTNGSTSGQTVTIRRVTSEPPFLSTTTCGATLAAAQSCTVTVTYSPLNQVAVGSAVSPAVPNTGTLSIESDDAASPAVIDLTGSAAPTAVAMPSNVSPTASYAVSSGSFTFPNTAVGNISPAQVVTITNTGTVTLHVGSLTGTGDFAVNGTCAQAVVAGATCTVSIGFTPTALGVRSAGLEIASDSGSSLDFITLLGVSYPSSLLVTPQALSFGSLLVGASSSQPVQITNNGQAPVGFTSIAATGDYAASSNCPASLAAGAACTAQVAFAPTAPGTRTGVLSVTSTASTLPLTVSLTGTGLQSHLTVNPVLAAFGNVGVGSSLNLTLTLANTGTAAISGVALAVTGDYAVATPCTTATLAPAQTCQVILSFSPAATGARPGTLTITSTDATSPLTVPLTGTGIQSHLQIAPGMLGFGTVPIGSSSTLSITISNTGTATITSLQTAIAGDYSIATPCTATALSPGASCTLTILFTPTALGLRNGTLTLTDSDPASPTSIALNGTGTTTPSHLQITPASLGFGSVTIGSAANLSVTLSNTGTVAIANLGLTITGDYAITAGCPGTLAAGQSCSLNVSFTPVTAGLRTGTLTITSSDPSSPAPIALSGTGSAATIQPHLQATPAALAFGSVQLGASSALTVTLSNPGTSTISSIAPAISGDYSFSTTCAATLGAGQSCAVTVTFAPTALGSRSGTLSVASSDPSSPTVVPLTGTGTASSSQLQVTPTDPTFGTVSVGSSASLALTLQNTGQTTITSITLTGTGDFAASTTCTSLAAGQSCSATLTFTPSALGARSGTLTIVSSDPSSPFALPLSGTGGATPPVPGSFTLTVNGGSTASAAVPSGSTANYILAVTPTGGFIGPVVFNCTPLTSAQYSSCAMLPSTVTLAGAPQTVALTITTLTSLTSPTKMSTLTSRLVPRGLLALLVPGCFLFLRRRRARRAIPILIAWTLLYASVLSLGGCGGGPNLTLRYVTPGTYQYQVTASSTATVPITQTVTVTLIITNN